MFLHVFSFHPVYICDHFKNAINAVNASTIIQWDDGKYLRFLAHTIFALSNGKLQNLTSVVSLFGIRYLMQLLSFFAGFIQIRNRFVFAWMWFNHCKALQLMLSRKLKYQIAAGQMWTLSVFPINKSWLRLIRLPGLFDTLFFLVDLNAIEDRDKTIRWKKSNGDNWSR